MSSPSSKTLPFLIPMRPNKDFITVDFPAPLGPTIEAISPLFTPILQLKTISIELYPHVIF